MVDPSQNLRPEGDMMWSTHSLGGVSVHLGLRLPEMVSIWNKHRKKEEKQTKTCESWVSLTSSVTSLLYKTATEDWGGGGGSTDVIPSDLQIMISLPQIFSSDLRADYKATETERNLMQSSEKSVIPEGWATSADERNLDFISVWNPSIMEQLVGSLIRTDWKLTTGLGF